MTVTRPRLEGYAVISREGMIATADGAFPEQIKIPADHRFYQDAVDRASAVINGRHSAEGGPKEKTRLAPVEAYSVEFGGGLATLRLGEDRDDLFVRLKLGDRVAAYKKVFTHGVADPSTGRIGFRVTNPVTAATLVTSEPVPFAVCD